MWNMIMGSHDNNNHNNNNNYDSNACMYIFISSAYTKI